MAELLIGSYRICKLQKGYTFVLQDMVNRRLLIGDELDVDYKYFENILKNIFAGLMADAKQKGGRDEIIDRTPFLILSNYDDLFPMDQEIWNTRILLKHVKLVPWLKEMATGLLYPYAWKMFFQEYGVVA